MRLTLYKFLIVALGMTFHQSLPAQPGSTPFTAISPLRISAIPAKVISFESIVSNSKVLLNWTVEGNEDADQFEVERSINGKPFVMAALVFATGKTDTDNYQFYEKKIKAKITYRIKVILKNGKIEYSPAIIAGSRLVRSNN